MRSFGVGAAVLVGVVVTTAVAVAEDPKGPPPLWSGKAEASYVATSGNSDTKTLGAAAEVEYQPGTWSAKARTELLRSEANGTVNARSFSSLLRGARKLTPRLEAYGQGNYLENTFAGIDHRLAGEAGLAYLVIPPGPHSLKAEGGLGYTRESRVAAGTRSFATAREGINYKWKFSKTGEFEEDAAVTEDLADSKDWRFSNAASLSAGLTTLFSLKLSHKIERLNLPAPGKKKTDTITSAALVAKF